MSWAKIEIHFQPEVDDPNDVMLFLSNYFKDVHGVPTGTVLFMGYGTDAEPPLTMTVTQQQRLGLKQSATAPTAHRTVTPIPMLQAGYSKADLMLAADRLIQMHTDHTGLKKIQAIKDLRIVAHLGLKEAKDAIDDAVQRAGGRP